MSLHNKKGNASYSAADIANAFIALAAKNGIKLDNMQLQKLVYIAYGYCAALFNQPLFGDRIEAWYFGPVIPNLYHQLKKYGSGAVTESIESASTVKEGEPEMKIIEGVWDSYHHYSSFELSDLTHQEGSPWSTVWEEHQKNIEIPYNTIKHYYEKKLRSGD